MKRDKNLILTIDDDPDICALIELHIRRWGHAAQSVSSAAELWSHLENHRPDVMLMDVMLGDADGSQLVGEVKERLPHVPILMITRSTSVEAAVLCMKHGATDYITKPLDFERLEEAVSSALQLSRLSRQVTDLSPGEPRDEFFGIIGSSQPMLRLYELIERVAPTDVPALILGETGTGKELIARAIHQGGARRQGPFVAVNAAAIPHELIESALFGHQKGAFTGASQTHLGYCEQADGGTLFLDEIGEMSFEVQAKLLRFLQDHVVERVGAQGGRKVDVRVLAATNVDPMRQIAARKLREDLYYRLRVVSLRLPPLRERGDDIQLLASRFLRRASERHGKELSAISPETQDLLNRYPWPGNVRELENVIEESVVMNQGQELSADMLPGELRSAVATGAARRGAADSRLPKTSEFDFGSPDESTLSSRELAEKRAVAEALSAARGRPDEAARRLRVSRATIYRKIKKYGLSTKRPN